MKILVISNLYPPYYLGGYELLCSQVCEGLKELGSEIIVLTSNYRTDNTDAIPVNDKGIIRDLSLYLSFDKPPKIYRKKRYDIGHSNYQITKKIITQHKPDIIFIWSLLRLTVGCARAVEDSGIPVMYTFNDENIKSYLPSSFGLTPKKIARKVIDGFIFSDITTNGLKFKNSICISKLLKENLLKSGLPIESSRVLYQGIPIDKFPPKKDIGLVKSQARILYTGQLHDYKGVHTLINAINEIIDKYGREYISLTIIGDGTEEYKNYLKELALKKGGNIEFRGKVPHEQLPQIYREHDIFVFPSIWQEPFGLTHLEAMASGTPVISTASGGQGEFLIDEENSLVFKEDDHHQLESHILRLINEPALSHKIAKNARTMVSQRFTLNRYITDIHKVLRDSIKSLSIVAVPRRFVKTEWGGTETVILETSKQLLSKGHNIEILTSKALNTNALELIDGITVRRSKHFYPYLGLSEDNRHKMDKLGGNLFSFELLKVLTDKPSIDIIHLHTLKRMGGICRYVAKKRGIPYVVTLHGGVFDVPIEQSNRLLDPAKGTIEWGKVLGYWVGSRSVLEDAAAIICLGLKEMDDLKTRFPDKKIIYLPNGVDTKKFSKGNGTAFRNKYGINTDKKILLNIGRIDPQKNQLYIIKLLPEILKVHQDVHLVLIGHVTNNDYALQIEQDISDLNLSNNVTLIKGLNTAELIDAYHAGEIFVLPSIHEPFGIVILEAWACGLSVIANKVGGIPDFVEDGIDGIMVDTANKEQFIRAIFDLLEDDEKRNKLAEAGRQKAVKDYDWEQIAGRLIDLYREVIDEYSLYK